MEETPQPVAPILSEPVPPSEAAPAKEESSSARSLFVVIVGWLLPGLGHLVQGKFGRAIIGFLTVGALAICGLWMRGNVFPLHNADAFGLLGFIADSGSGAFYLLAHTIEKAGPDVSRAAGDNGTRLLATAGVLNLLFILDALEISRGHKS
jgi:hypothetical protein